MKHNHQESVDSIAKEKTIKSMKWNQMKSMNKKCLVSSKDKWNNQINCPRCHLITMEKD